MKEAKIVGHCNIIVKSKKMDVKTNLPKDMIESIVYSLVTAFNMNEPDQIDKLLKTKLSNAKFDITLNEDNVLIFEPTLTKKQAMRLVVALTDVIGGMEDEPNHN